MKLRNAPEPVDSYSKWANWSPKPKKQPVKRTNIVAALIVAVSAIQLMDLPIV